MVVVRNSVLAGALACMMAGQPVLSLAQQDAPQQQTIPDGPKPQTIPDAPSPQGLGVGPVTPGAGTTPDSNGDSSTPASQDGAVPNKLPTSAAQKQDDGPPPEVVTGGQGPDAFTLRVQTNFVEVPFTVKDSKGGWCRG